MTKYVTELKELSEFFPELASFKEYLCSKSDEGLSLEITEKMSITETQNYKEVVQLALKAKKLTGERMSRSNFQKRKGFNFISGQSSKKSKNLDFFGNSSSSSFGSISSPKFFQTPQPSKLGTSPPSFAFRGRQILGQKGVQIVDSFILEFVVCHRYIIIIGKLDTSRDFAHF